MANISIISACNNHCKYCFQQDSYHEMGKMLTYDEVLDVFDWIVNKKKLGILGGEPTLHPDIVKIVETAFSMFEKPVLFTNLLCDKETIRDLQRFAPGMLWLINTTTCDELKDKFDSNIEYLSKVVTSPITAGLTFLNEPETDEKFTNNLISIGKKYSKLIVGYRIAIATPYHRSKVSLASFEEPIVKFCELAKKETPDIKIYFDCPINNCQVPLRTVAKLIEEYNVGNVKTIHHCLPIVEVMADKSVKYCTSLPDGFLEVENYRMFDNDHACFKYMVKLMNEYMQKYHCICKKYKDCGNSICDGPCFSLTENIRRQELEDSNFQLQF